jgi:hypothetical protein
MPVREKCFPSRTGQALQELREFVISFPHNMAPHIAPVDVVFRAMHALLLQISANLFRHARFCHGGRRDAHRTDETNISFVEHMAFVSIDAHTPACAGMRASRRLLGFRADLWRRL